MIKKHYRIIIAISIILIALGYVWQTLYKTNGVQVNTQYSLIDMHGNSVDADTNNGKKQVIFFGYTLCPDVCPTTLQTLTSALEEIKNPDEWIGVFVTIDPERDTAEVLEEYLSENFHKNITAYTGTNEGIAEIASAFQAKYSVDEATKDDEFYLMQHTAFIYFLNKDGSLSSISLYDISKKEMIERMQDAK